MAGAPFWSQCLTDKHFACQSRKKSHLQALCLSIGEAEKIDAIRLVLYQDVQLSLTNVSAIHCFSESLLASAFLYM